MLTGHCEPCPTWTIRGRWTGAGTNLPPAELRNREGKFAVSLAASPGAGADLGGVEARRQALAAFPMGLTFHRLIRKDLRSVLAYYEEAVGPELARRVCQEFEKLVAGIERNPRRFHPIATMLRRANFRSFRTTCSSAKPKGEPGYLFCGITGDTLTTVRDVSEWSKWGIARRRGGPLKPAGGPA